MKLVWEAHPMLMNDLCSDYCPQAQPADYLSRVAWMAGIKLETFMLDNVGNVKDLDAPLAGTSLLLCGPAQGCCQ
jgi:predicted Rdx family selenoprotein